MNGLVQDCMINTWDLDCEDEWEERGHGDWSTLENQNKLWTAIIDWCFKDNQVT